jgi:integrase
LPKKEIIAPPKPTLLNFLESYIKERKSVLKGKGKIFKTLLNHLITYKKWRKKAKFDYEDITLDFFNDFLIKYLYEKNQFATNYAAKLVDTIRQIMEEAEERGYHSNRTYSSKKFRVSQVEVDNIYLSTTELTKMYEYDLSQNERLERVRDLFIVGCYTGLRFSDFTNIRSEHIVCIEGKYYISLITQKTSQQVTIPMKSCVKDIYEKYGNQMPKAITNQKMNDYLKELGKLIGLDEKISITSMKGGKRIDEIIPKHDLISTHTARRSFATNAYKEKIDPMKIMKITGHTTERQFLKYIKVNSEENAQLMAEHSFFN